MSLGGDQDDPRLDAAIRAAGEAGVLVVCSAGNDGRDIDSKPSYPVSIAAPNLIGVAATAPEDGRRLGGFSNYGRITVPVAAPGEEVLSTASDGGYELRTGTSMAAPMVTGAAALMAATRRDLSAVELRALLLQSARRAPLPVGSGYVDALDAVLAAAGSAGYDAGQRPLVRILTATASGSRTTVQFALLGASQAVRTYRLSASRRRLAELRRGSSPFTVRVRARAGTRLRLQALDAHGRALSTDTARVSALRRGKGGVGRGNGVGPGGTVTAR